MTLGFPRESVFCTSFICSLHLYWSSFGVVVRCRGREAFYNFMVKSQYFNGSVSLGWDLYKCFLIYLCDKKRNIFGLCSQRLARAPKGALGDREGQRSVARCSPWGRGVRHDIATEQQRKSLTDLQTHWFFPWKYPTTQSTLPCRVLSWWSSA